MTEALRVRAVRELSLHGDVDHRVTLGDLMRLVDECNALGFDPRDVVSSTGVELRELVIRDLKD